MKQTMQEVEIKIYLKSQRKPVKVYANMLEDAKQLFALFENENRYVRYGNFIFDKNDFQFAIYKIITSKI